MQTLTKLFLEKNQIGRQGAAYLFNALQQNTVRSSPPSYYVIHYPIYTDTHYTFSRRQWNRQWRNWTSCQSSTTKHSKIIVISYRLIHHLTYTDTHCTWPPGQSTWSPRSSKYCRCSTTKQSNARSRLLILTLIHYFTQTLTTLYLQKNAIGDRGAEHLANALQQNRVRSLHLLIASFSI